MIELPNNITSLILKTLSIVSTQGSRYHTRNVYKFNFEDVFSECWGTYLKPGSVQVWDVWQIMSINFNLQIFLLLIPLLTYFLSGWQFSRMTALHCLCALNPQSKINYYSLNRKQISHHIFYIASCNHLGIK